MRELRNLVERLVIFGGEPLSPQHLPSAIFEARGFGHLPDAAGVGETGLLRLPTGRPRWSLKDLRGHCEREYIESVLRHTNWNIAAAARLLDLQRTYLHQKIGALGLQRPGGDGE